MGQLPTPPREPRRAVRARPPKRGSLLCSIECPRPGTALPAGRAPNLSHSETQTPVFLREWKPGPRYGAGRQSASSTPRRVPLKSFRAGAPRTRQPQCTGCGLQRQGDGASAVGVAQARATSRLFAHSRATPTDIQDPGQDPPPPPPEQNLGGHPRASGRGRGGACLHTSHGGSVWHTCGWQSPARLRWGPGAWPTSDRALVIPSCCPDATRRRCPRQDRDGHCFQGHTPC